MHHLTPKMIWISSDWKHTGETGPSGVTCGYRNFSRDPDVIGEADITVKNQ